MPIRRKVQIQLPKRYTVLVSLVQSSKHDVEIDLIDEGRQIDGSEKHPENA
jgi:hypothetical protein